MIIINLKGGLGNQMFQYALGRALALKNNEVLKLQIDNLSRAEELGNIYRPFDLEAFSIEKNLASEAEIKALKYPYGLVSKIQDLFNRKILRNNHVIFEPSILNLTGSQYLDGYWQSPDYFENIRSVLLKDFTLKETLSISGQTLANTIENTNSVSIHIRRGDYVQNSRVYRENGVCSPDYYKKALEIIVSHKSEPTFFIFSDDIAWVKNNLQLPNSAIFVSDETLSAPQELYLMSRCKHNIIANSSFSWWSAWLNINPAKIVIAPTPWFDNVKYDKHLIPATWKILPKT